jgi:hypothetical protein
MGLTAVSIADSPGKVPALNLDLARKMGKMTCVFAIFRTEKRILAETINDLDYEKDS